MKNYIVFNASTGEIVGYGTCQDCDMQIEIGGNAVMEGEGSPATHYVRDGKLIAYTPQQAEAKRVRPLNAVSWSNDPIGWTYPPLAVALESRRASLWDRAKARRSELENSPFEHADKIFDADSVSQQRISSAVLLATLGGPEFSIEWTLADNTTADLSGIDLIGLGVALGQRTAEIFKTAAEVRALIDSAETLSQLESVTEHSFFVSNAKVTARSA